MMISRVARMSAAAKNLSELASSGGIVVTVTAIPK